MCSYWNYTRHYSGDEGVIPQKAYKGMAASIGKIEEFDSATEDWRSYLERLEHYLGANQIKEEVKTAAFLSCIGKRTFGLLRALTAPKKPGEKSYEELVEILTKHLAPKPLVIAERYRFHKRDQKEGETVREYVSALQKLTEHCDFQDHLEDTLRDRLVCGLRDVTLQKRLLTKEDLTFARAVEMAETAERAEKDAAELQVATTPEVHRLPVREPTKDDRRESGTGRMRQHQSPQCFRCGRTHQPETCWFRDQQCRSCKKVGHAERVCRSRKRLQEVKGSAEPYRSRDKSIREMDKEEDETNLFWGTIKTKNGTDQWKGGHALVVEVMEDSLPLKMELDTGAAVSLLPYALYRERYSHLSLQNTKTCLRTYTGERIYPKGEVLVKVKKGRQETTLPLLVVEGNGPPLLGRDWLAHIPIDWKEIKTLSRGTADEKLASLKAQYPRLWKERLKVATGIKAKLHLKEGATPVFMKARPVPYSVRKKVEDELNRLQELGIISPVSWSEWATPIVVVPKQDGAIRLCGDFKVSVNPALKIDMYPLPKVEDIFATLGKGELYSKIDLLQAYNQLEVEVASRNILTINTHKGLFQYSRVPFGIAAAPAIWQRTLELVLQGIPRVHC